jgi:linoleoyl-CoA desaturase
MLKSAPVWQRSRLKEVEIELAAKQNSPLKALPFTQHHDFRKVLNERVEAYLRENKLGARDVPAMYLKTSVVLAWWLVTYLLLILAGFPLLVNAVLCIVLALAMASIGFNVLHDANHGSYSKRPWVNKLFSFSSELLGISGFRWRVKHNIWHHTYTNIAGYDGDVETYGSMRLSPHQPWKPLYKYQAWYFPLVYSFIGFDFFIRDFLMIFTGRSDATHVYPKMSRYDKAVFWCGKLFFFTIMIAVPLLVFPWWQVLIGFTLIILIVGMATGVVFQLAHIMEVAAFPEPQGSPQHIDNDWAVHEMETTVNFAPHNMLLNFYIGGLNYQVEHHLLPHICHLNYPKLAPIVSATCEEFGIAYNSIDTWHSAFASHWRELRRLGQAPVLGTVPAK